MNMTHSHVLECYMVLGGILQYLNYMRPSLSLAQNIDYLFFKPNSPLKNEFEMLFSSLFKKPDRYIAVIRELAKNSCGLTRQHFLDHNIVPEGKEPTKILEEN